MTPAAEPTLLSSAWLLRVGLSMTETDMKVDEEHKKREEEGSKGGRRGRGG